MISISKAVIKSEEKYLLLKRAEHSRSFPGVWDFAGGKDDIGETPEESVTRETKEETSLEITSGEEVKRAEYHDEHFDLLFHYFSPKILSGNVSLSPDHEDFIWASEEEIQNLALHPSVRCFFG
jgi:8-oxo-dGTP diphosphatase